jgi:nucleoside-diphosphate-sugar epimerase
MVIQQRLQERGHDIITAGRTTGDIRCDIADERQLARLWEQADQVDAVVCAAGEVKYAPLDQLSSSDFLR